MTYLEWLWMIFLAAPIEGQKHPQKRRWLPEAQTKLMINLMISQSIPYLKNNISKLHGKVGEQHITTVYPLFWGHLPLYLKNGSLLIKITSKFRFYTLKFIRQDTFNDFWVNLPCCPHFGGTVTPEFNTIACNLNKTFDKLNLAIINTL